MDLRPIECQRLALSQQQLQSLHILEMDVHQLDSFLSNLALDNPFVEYESPTHWNHGFISSDNEGWQNMLNVRHNQVTLQDHLMEQLRFSNLTREQRYLVEQLIIRVDERGYLPSSSSELSAELSISDEETGNALRVLQSFSPTGVGARSLKECLLLQLRKKPTTNELAIRIVRNYLELLAKRRFERIAELCGTAEESVLDARQIILKLNPKPGNGFSSNEDTPFAPPDLIIHKDESGHLSVKPSPIIERAFHVNVDSAASTRLCIGDDEDGLSYIRERLQTAHSVRLGLQRRRKTLLACGEILLELQQSFFNGRHGFPRPCSMLEMAEAMSVHPATITRLVKNKYLICERGTLPLAFFFSRSVYHTNNGEITPSCAQAEISRLIGNENPIVPLSDQVIVRELGKMGIEISRRTIAKYREALGIPSSYDRKHTR